VLTEPVDANGRAGIGHALNDGPANSTAAARDQRNLAR
jgi:hypothetical protein